jgi:hypothetical protein
MQEVVIAWNKYLLMEIEPRVNRICETTRVITKPEENLID